MVEAQIHYVMDALEDDGRGAASQASRSGRTRQERWNDAIQREAAADRLEHGRVRVLVHRRNGRNATLWPDLTWRFRRLTRRFDVSAYDSVSSPRGSATDTGLRPAPALAGSGTGTRG